MCMRIIQSLFGKDREYSMNGATYIVTPVFRHHGRIQNDPTFDNCIKKMTFAERNRQCYNDSGKCVFGCRKGGKQCSRKRNSLMLESLLSTAACHVTTEWRAIVIPYPRKS